MKDRFPYILLIYLLIRAPLLGSLGLYRFGTAINMVELLLIIYMMTFENFRKVISQKINIVWILLTIYHSINYTVKVPAEKPIGMILRLLTCAFLMLMTEYLYLKDSKRTLKYLCVGFLIYIMIAFNMVSIDADFENRLKGDALHPNQFAQAAGVGLLILAYAKYYLNLSWVYVALLTLPGLIAILGCGSRNGLALFFIYCIILAFGKQVERRFSVGKIFSLSVICVLLYLASTLFLENTMVGGRMLKTTEQSSNFESLQTGVPILDMMGDRGIYYYMGWANFLENPISGIGLYNFANYNHYPVPIHSEYMIHLAEGGLIGAILYLIFIIYILYNLIYNFKFFKSAESFALLAMFLAYMVVGVTARCFDVHQFYPLLGLCVVSVIYNERQRNDTDKRRFTRVYAGGFLSK